MKKYELALIHLAYLITLPVAAADSHCTSQEQTVFSCSLGRKLVSVCASRDISPTSGYVHYRFGPKNATEFTYPTPSASFHRANIQARTLMFSGGGGSYLRFINDQYSYIVYTAIGKGWGTKDGVAVEKNGKLLSNLKCKDVPVSNLGDDFFSRAGLGTDETEFLLP